MIGGPGTNENNLSLEGYTGGTLLMGAGNTYAGRTNIGRSTFEVSVLANAGVASSLGTGSTSSAIVMNDTTSTAATVSNLRYIGSGNSVTDRAVRLFTDGESMPSLTAVIENAGTGTLKFTSAFTVEGNTLLARTFRLTGTNTGANEMVSITDGPSSVLNLEKTGTGKWTLTGNSSYTGGTTISGGTLQLGAGGATGNVGAGGISLSSGAVLSTNRNNTLTLANAITGGGAVSIENASTGTTILTSTGNTYSGGTTVTNGKLLVNNASGSGTGTGMVAVAQGAVLGGSGRIAASAELSVLVCGTLSVGENSLAASDLEISTAGEGMLFLDNASVLEFDLISGAGLGDNTATLAAADRLVLGGLMQITPGATLRVNDNGMTGWAIGDIWKLMDWTTLSGLSSGTFTDLELPSLPSGMEWDVSQFYSLGTIAIAVPEPGKSVLLACGGVWLLLRRRRAEG
jgi:autotransporter-associated beta strand protein